MVYHDDGIVMPECKSGQKVSYSDALYFSVVTWTTLGYGDIRPKETTRLWAAGEALFGYVYMSILIAYILKLLGASSTPNVRNRTSDRNS